MHTPTGGAGGPLLGKMSRLRHIVRIIARQCGGIDRIPNQTCAMHDLTLRAWHHALNNPERFALMRAALSVFAPPLFNPALPFGVPLGFALKHPPVLLAGIADHLTRLQRMRRGCIRSICRERPSTSVTVHACANAFSGQPTRCAPVACAKGHASV